MWAITTRKYYSDYSVICQWKNVTGNYRATFWSYILELPLRNFLKSEVKSIKLCLAWFGPWEVVDVIMTVLNDGYTMQELRHLF
jgi:hypothetical protein